MYESPQIPMNLTFVPGTIVSLTDATLAADKALRRGIRGNNPSQTHYLYVLIWPKGLPLVDRLGATVDANKIIAGAWTLAVPPLGSWYDEGQNCDFYFLLDPNASAVNGYVQEVY